jgi:Ran GTPase-activating protein (RanGAP) involved in mRNA processing and transport
MNDVINGVKKEPNDWKREIEQLGKIADVDKKDSKDVRIREGDDEEKPEITAKGIQKKIVEHVKDKDKLEDLIDNARKELAKEAFDVEDKTKNH